MSVNGEALPCSTQSSIQNQDSFVSSYLLILRCLVAIVEQLEAQVLVLLQEILKLILLKRERENCVEKPRGRHA